MRPFNQRLKIRTIAKRWNDNYKNLYERMPDKLEILKALEKLDTEKCTAEDIEKIIGNKTWTHFLCMTCEEYQHRGVLINDDYICFNCIKDALDLFNKDAVYTEGEEE